MKLVICSVLMMAIHLVASSQVKNTDFDISASSQRSLQVLTVLRDK